MNRLLVIALAAALVVGACSNAEYSPPAPPRADNVFSDEAAPPPDAPPPSTTDGSSADGSVGTPAGQNSTAPQ